MKKISIHVLLSLVCIHLSASTPLRIGVISDTHYLSPSLMKEGEALDKYVSAGGKNVKVIPQVLQQVLAEYEAEDKLDILLISGDMTKDGEKQSHLDFVNLLKPLQKKGTRIFVVPGNHDVNMPVAVAYDGNKTTKTDNVSAQEFADIYKDCGYASAISRDKASLSYLASLDDDTWLLTIDAARYTEYTTQSISAGRIKPETEKWVMQMLDDARKKNKQVLAMMHWGVVEHIVLQASLYKDYLVTDWERWVTLLADNGVKAIFTGHFHANDITAFTSANGNTIYDIETGTLASYPFAYRFIDYTPKGMDITTRNITSLSAYPNLASDEKEKMMGLTVNMAKQKLKNIGYDLPDFLMMPMAQIVAQLFVLHLAGDEQDDEGLKFIIAQLAQTLDTNVDSKGLDADFAPADNNVKIEF